ncbi:MAG TPA: DmsC/YnfH family molybdoenzyme membrane anchor subunit, partial [Dongiaceae bacterium]
MHPALSVIIFTVMSGAGYGLLFLLGICGAAGWLTADRWLGAAAFGLAFAAVVAGLLSSTVHLGHPERAWRALSQWRSSWLSREGVAAIVTFLPAGLFALAWILGAMEQQVAGFLGLLTAVWAAITVYCTAMIYASLKPVQRWNNGYVVPCYLLLALMTGAAWLDALLFLFGRGGIWPAAGTLLALSAGWLMKLAYWRFIDSSRSESSAETATGLGHLGKVRLLDSPNTEENYLQREMGFRVARKHALKLRMIATLLAFLLPLLLTVLAIGALTGGLPWLSALLTAVAALATTAGVLIERWLFFA